MSVRNKAKDQAKRAYKTQYRVSNWPEYNRSLIERGSLTLQAVFHLPLRATQGLAQSLFQSMGLVLPVPDHTTLSRRATRLVVQLPR